MEKWAIIVAGGRGLRMGSDIPKQFIQLDSKPIIAKTIERFLEAEPLVNLVVVVPEDQLEIWDAIEEEYFLDEHIVTTVGGATRFESVQNGLKKVFNGLVAIHDAVRPYVSPETIRTSYQSAAEFGSGVAVVELKDSIRELTRTSSVSRNRENFRLVQTPQTFRVEEIKEAYLKTDRTDHTDDASVYEAAGFQVSLIEGSYENIKITTPEDLR